MLSKQEQLLHHLLHFRSFEHFRLGHHWILVRFISSFTLTRHRPFLKTVIIPELQFDYSVISNVKQAFKESRNRKPEDLLLFRSLWDYCFVNFGDIQYLSNDEAERLTRVIARLAAFLNIYNLETFLSVSIIPLVDLVDAVDDEIVAKFKLGQDNSTLLEPIRKMIRKTQRRFYQAVVSGALALLTIYLLTPATELTKFLLDAIVWGSLTVVGLYVVSSIGVWRSFPALLSSPQRELQLSPEDSEP